MTLKNNEFKLKTKVNMDRDENTKNIEIIYIPYKQKMNETTYHLFSLLKSRDDIYLFQSNNFQSCFP